PSYVYYDLYMFNFMLDRFEHCDASFAGQPFKEKAKEIADILLKTKFTDSDWADTKEDRKFSILSLKNIQKPEGIPDETLAKQFIDYWRLYGVDCDMVN